MRYDGGVILTLDLATRTGFAVGRPGDGDPDFGFHDLPSTADDIGRFAQAFGDWLEGKIDRTSASLVVYEQPSVFNKTTPATAIKLNGLAYHTELICRDHGIAVAKANPSKLKKFWTGSGRAQKDDMVRQARRHGFLVTDHNVADALAIWAFTAFTLSPEHAERFRLGPLGARAA